MSVNAIILEGLISKWQDILRLRDWDVILTIVNTPWRKSGDIKIDITDKKAVLLINSTPKSTNLEELVVHELLHLKLWGMDQMIEELLSKVFGTEKDDAKREFAMSQFFTLLESTVEDLAKGFLKANGNDEGLSFGRLADEVNEEIRIKTEEK